ncbi:MAG TPA: beta-N-acetylhexosaminidase [Methylibium sp.]|uniref:beta-N-acetylhexosaminidase n=1 Tax=Methylibium sp. TaxID=2067992 RepID=UPI002DBD6CEC|nr:beta-N-acetylhexosaminidase [Methylibium sp.]HEU4458650.1 beta-N-acetylhexosaminidase [Methylibium sp.]
MSTAATVLHAPLVIDIAGPVLDANDRRRIAHPLVGGLVFFSRHWIGRAQMTELCAEIKSLRPDLLLCVDHEGGRVQRFRGDGFSALPPMRAFGERWMRDDAGPGSGALAACGAASACGYVLAAELRACGLDLSFAPVLDLDHGTSGVIGDRAFHRDPRVVGLLGKSLVHGLLQAGMAACGKHFPGHGFAAADSHHAVATDGRGLDELLADDAAPYRWLAPVLPAVMPAHVVYPKVDRRPAGFSARWLQQVLRERLGFTGAIVSDDLSMHAASVAGSFTEAALAALGAGCDLALLCNQSVPEGGAALDALLDGLLEAQAQGRWRPDAASEARRLELLPQTAPRPWDELMHHAAYRRALDLAFGAPA